jgi:hypothetical protein
VRQAVFSMAVALTVTGCHYEDRGYARDLAALELTLQMRDRLQCLAVRTGGYPGELRAVVSEQAVQLCGPPSDHLSSFFQYAKELSWHDHVWVYTPADGGSRRGCQQYALTSADTRGAARYASFWMDASGVLREARGRPATADDPPADLQESGFARYRGGSNPGPSPVPLQSGQP